MICDVARPRDVAASVAAVRDDVFVFDGGMLDVPGSVNFNFDFGFPSGKAYACMAETIALALEGRFEDYTLGKQIKRDRVDEITQIANKHGFELSGFRSFGRPVITRADQPDSKKCEQSSKTTNRMNMNKYLKQRPGRHHQEFLLDLHFSQCLGKPMEYITGRILTFFQLSYPDTWEATMSKARLLIVEDDFDISNMLRIYFSGQEYDVDIAPRGSDALAKTRQQLPHLIVLDIMLPDIDGYEVCRRLRTQPRTRHIPVIFLTQKDERSDKLQGLELGADDYITKPFDIEELKLRVQNAIARAERESLTDPRSGLPSGRLIEEELRQIIRLDDWALMDIRVNQFGPFKDEYGFVAGDDVLRFTAMTLNEVVDTVGTMDDFIGHAGEDNFIVITTEEHASKIHDEIKSRFAEEVLTHYNFMDREQGFITSTNQDGEKEQLPLMSIGIGIVSPSKFQFADIREITELAAEERRKDI